MKISIALTLLALATGFASAQTPAASDAPAATAPAKPVAVIKVNGKTITVMPGDKFPALNSGDKVSVVSGQATFTVNGKKVTADAGASFYLAGAPVALGIAVQGGSITVTQGTASTTYTQGEIVAPTIVAVPPTQIYVNNLPSVSVAPTTPAQDLKNPPAAIPVVSPSAP